MTEFTSSKCKMIPLTISNKIRKLRQHVLKLNQIELNELCEAEIRCYFNWIHQLTTIDDKNLTTMAKSNAEKLCDDRKLRVITFFTSTIICLLIAIFHFNITEYFMSIRCFVPNNYLIWEATRPISDCQFCFGIDRPLILPNISQADFLQYAYMPQPIIIKNAVMHWPARQQLNFQYLKELYHRHPDALTNFADECQFLPFKSSFTSLDDFFNMPEMQVMSGQPTWYVGFSNCQPKILAELRTLYPRPHFLPDDAEIPNTDYTFLGFNEGAVMHLDYIPRLMWQAQLQGNKTWNVSPTPECDSKCSSFSFYVEPGDAVLIDTRIWYHGTSVAPGHFSMTIQSEYG